MTSAPAFRYGDVRGEGYLGLVACLVARRRECGLMQEALNDLCGFQDNYISHLERPLAEHGRVAGPVVLNRWMSALGVTGVVVATKTVDEVVASDPLPRLSGELAHRRRLVASRSVAA